jgi:hypothetical protein
MWATLTPEFGLADLVDGVGEVVLNVETVEGKVSLRGMFAVGVDVALGHVQRHGDQSITAHPACGYVFQLDEVEPSSWSKCQAILTSRHGNSLPFAAFGVGSNTAVGTCRYGKEGTQMNQDQANPERATVVDRQENKRKPEAESEECARNDVLPDELGGPFVESGADEECGVTRKKERGDHIPPNGTGG